MGDSNFSWCIPCARMFLRLSDGKCPVCRKPLSPPMEILERDRDPEVKKSA